MLWLLGTFATVNLLFAPLGVLIPLITKFNLADDWRHRGLRFESALAIVVTVNRLGGLAGAIALSAWGGLKRRRVRGGVRHRPVREPAARARRRQGLARRDGGAARRRVGTLVPGHRPASTRGATAV